MSNTLYVFINRKDIPNSKLLQSSMDATDFGIQLDPDFNVFEDEGHWPCVCGITQNGGFEFYLETTQSHIEQGDELPDEAQSKDTILSFVWGSSLHDCACAMAVATVLAKENQASVSYEFEPCYTTEALIDESKCILLDLAKQSKT